MYQILRLFVGTQTNLSSSSSSTILSKCRWSRCPSLASINQWQLRLFPPLWLLTDGGVGDSILPTVALRIHPPQDTAAHIPTCYFHDRRHLSRRNAAAALALTDTLWFSGAPVRLSGVDTGRYLVAAHLEAWVAVEVGLTSRVDARHRHAALLGGARERAGQQEGCL